MKKRKYVVEVECPANISDAAVYRDLRDAVFNWHVESPRIQGVSVLPEDEAPTTERAQEDLAVLMHVYGVMHTLTEDNKCPVYKNNKCAFAILGAQEAADRLHSLIKRVSTEAGEE